ncbi:MAG TPA: hypothetical protein VGW38_01965 [Chloroflexota bacterium]|nr:hypothetical protein [Chloroflexota bacterium]
MHAVVMLAFAVVEAEEIVHAVGDVLILGVVVAALLWLRRRDADSEQARRTSPKPGKTLVP